MLAGELGADRAADRPHDRVHPRRDTRLVGPHRLDDQVRERREGEADADAEQRRGDVDLPRLVRDREHDERDRGHDRRRATSGTFEPTTRRQPAADRAEDQQRDRRGDQVEAGLGDGRAEAVARRRRRLHELRDQDEGAVHPEADQQRREVRRPDAGQPHHLHVDERVARAALRPHPERGEHRGEHEQPDRLRRAPAPGRRLADREQERDEPAREQERADPVHVPRRANRRLGDEQRPRRPPRSTSRRAGSRRASGS